jgi:hypothetical protein
MQSISETDFECFASSGANTAETMLPILCIQTQDSTGWPAGTRVKSLGDKT